MTIVNPNPPHPMPTPYALRLALAYQTALLAGFDGLAGALLEELRRELASLGDNYA